MLSNYWLGKRKINFTPLPSNKFFFLGAWTHKTSRLSFRPQRSIDSISLKKELVTSSLHKTSRQRFRPQRSIDSTSLKKELMTSWRIPKQIWFPHPSHILCYLSYLAVAQNILRLDILKTEKVQSVSISNSLFNSQKMLSNYWLGKRKINFTPLPSNKFFFFRGVDT